MTIIDWMSVKWKDETRGRKSVKTYPRRNKHIRALAQNAHAQMGWWPCNGMAVSKADFCEERKQIAILKWRFRGV